ncbi:hypothetical protein [Leifsonia soli]|uniref:Uncharacterized protein n=1 Tax=Leifsonia soli TaxID=582665 RepID=A0A852T4D3_9MICO|nr:hypothetical protein [Leifsonia soli]NYD75673.1 hypothetical protein [Leifsonia soli]
MTFEAIVGLAISAPLAIVVGAVMVVWRKRIAEWNRRFFATGGDRYRPFVRASTPGSVAAVGCFILGIGVFNGARLIFAVVT